MLSLKKQKQNTVASICERVQHDANDANHTNESRTVTETVTGGRGRGGGLCWLPGTGTHPNRRVLFCFGLKVETLIFGRK